MTRFNPQRNHRRSIRLKGHDYAQVGVYFITICTYNRACIFGGIADGIMVPTAAGDAATRCWLAIPDHYPFVQLDAFVVMPNHVHGIIHIVDRLDVGAKNISPLRSPLRSPQRTRHPPQRPDQLPRRSIPPGFRSPSKTVGSVVRGFKIGVTKWVRANSDIHVVWQRNYYEHIVRSEDALTRIRRYIAENPARWVGDAQHPAARKGLLRARRPGKGE